MTKSTLQLNSGIPDLTGAKTTTLSRGVMKRAPSPVFLLFAPATIAPTREGVIKEGSGKSES
jgi:hypothetical protein